MKQRDHKGLRGVTKRRGLKLTKYGKYFIFLTLGIGFAAVNTGNNLLFLILAGMLALIVTSGVLSETALRGVFVSRRLPRRVFANETFFVTVKLHNKKRHFPSFSLQLFHQGQHKKEEIRAYCAAVAPRSAQHVTYRDLIPQRGEQKLASLIVRTRFPFSLFEKSLFLHNERAVLVYPQIYPLFDETDDRKGHGHGGVRRRYRFGDFHGLRDYKDGDDPRAIAWRKSASLGRLLVREHERPESQHVTISLDNRGPEHPSTELVAQQEYDISRAASMAVDYLQRGYWVGLSTNTCTVRPGNGVGQMDRILSSLATIQFRSIAEPLRSRRRANTK